MKICGNCNNEYSENEKKCPVCGSTVIKKIKNSNSGEEEYKRIKEEVDRKRKTRRNILIGGATIILLVVLVGLGSIFSYINNPQRKINKESKQLYTQSLQEINAGNYDDARMYLDQISSEWDEYEKVLSSYEQISAKEAEIRSAEKISEVTAAVTKYKEENNDEGVISVIEANMDDVSSDDSLMRAYSDAVDHYKSSTFTKADEYISENDYISAVSVLTTAQNIIGEDAEINKKVQETKLAEIKHKVAEYEASGDYAEAITYINDNMDVIGVDSEVLFDLSNCEQNYREQIILEAEESYEAEGYEGAISIINSGLAILENDDELLKEKEKYINLEPVLLSALQAYLGELYNPGIATDNMGNKYENCYLAFDRTDSATYDIGGEYQSLKATVAVTKADINSALYTNNYASIKILGDGKILYENSLIDPATKPFEIDVDITGVIDLEIEMTGKNTNLNYYDGLYLILGDAELCK